MKGFTREETRFSLCGLNCCLCSMYLGGYCPGCGGGAGNQSCAFARCSLQHGGISFCWECPEYPCSRYKGFDDGDSFVPHRNRRQDVAKARALGLDAYLAQLKEKRAILDELTAHYKDAVQHGGVSPAPGGFALCDGCTGQPAGTGRAIRERAGPGRCGIPPGGGGPPGHQPETKQETERGVRLWRLPG